VDDALREWERLAPGVLAGESLGEGGASAVSVAKRDDLITSGVDARELDGGFVGFGAAVAEETLSDLAGSDLRQLLRERDDGFVRKKSGGVLELVDLRLDLRGDAWVRVSDGDGDNAAEEIEILVALDVQRCCMEAWSVTSGSAK